MTVIDLTRQLNLLHAVRARRDRRAGHDSHRLARIHFTMPAASRGGFTNNAQSCGNALQIFSAHCVAIHLRTVEWRQIGIGDDVFGKETIKRVSERYLLCRERSRVLLDDSNGFGDRNHFG